MVCNPIFNAMSRKIMALAALGLLVSFSADGKPGKKSFQAPGMVQVMQTDSTSRRVAANDQINVIGNVADDNGEPIPGATIILKGNADVHAIADIDGNYSITVPDRWAVLTYSCIGFLPQEIQVGNRRVVNVTMTEDIGQLQDAVVVAYGQQRKESVVASIAAIEPEKLKVGTSRSLRAEMKLSFSSASRYLE